MVTFTDSDDRRSAYLRNKAIQNANAVRERRATVENPQWAMSRPADWYQDRGNLASIKDTLVSQQGNRDFWTTDQDESRNAYQMLMNQMKGGDKGARMMDLRGLPSVVQSDPNKYRRGRTMFQDPSKAQGFLGDVGSLFTGKNKAAVRAQEYNPFPKAGFGKDWYKDQFPIASGLGSMMEAAENFIPGATWAKQFLPKRNRVPLERHPDYLEGGSEFLPKKGIYNEIPEIPFVEDMDIEDLSYTPETVWGPEGDPSIIMAGMEPYPDWEPYKDEWYDLQEDIDGVEEDLTENIEETTETFTDLGDTHAFTKEFSWGAGDYEDVQEYVTALIGDPDSTWYKMDQDELVKILIKQNRIKEK